ncbi:MAG TPA: AAA family ATPase [Candidatus Binataceae bacterium]|nr:AAA family ATPase [Candidatus Binataceae bacterium]
MSSRWDSRREGLFWKQTPGGSQRSSLRWDAGIRSEGYPEPETELRSDDSSRLASSYTNHHLGSSERSPETGYHVRQLRGLGGVAIELLERDEQLQRLGEAFALAREGQARIVAIAGEAGTGKTSLVDRFVATHGKQARLHRGACENLSTPEALLPLRDILRAGGESFDPSFDHIQSFEVLLRLLGKSSDPSVLVIEDLHWADTATLDLIRFLVRRIGRLRVLVLLTYRDEELDARSAVRNVLGEAAAGSIERMTLEALSVNAVARLAATHGRDCEELYALTAGNPFMVSEALAVEGDLPTHAVRDATLARASRLAKDARAVLEAVSIFPRRADTAMIADMVKHDFAGLDACVEKGMLTLDGAVLRFRHELARRAIEAFIAPIRKRALHQAVVDELVRRPNARASEIAHHAERAADVETQLKFAGFAGNEAARAGAPREAAAHYGAILKHREKIDAATLTDTLERYADQSYLMGAADAAMTAMQEAAELRRHSGETLKLGHDLTRLTRFAWMCGRRREAERFVAEAIGVLEKAPAGRELAWAYSHKSQLEMLASLTDSAVQWGDRALALAERLGEEEIVVHALGNIGTAKADSSRSGSLVELKRSFELALAGKFHDHVERACCNLTCTHYVRRECSEALAYIERGVTYAGTQQLVHWEGYLRGWRAMVLLDQGNWHGAEDEIELILSRAYASGVYRFPALVALARLRIRRGDADSETPLREARGLSATLAELQRSVYIAALTAERAWLGIPDDAAAVGEAITLLQEVYALATEREARWVIEDMALWLHVLGHEVENTAELSPPFRDHCEGRWQEAAVGWKTLGRPYDEALALSEGDEAAQRASIEIFDRLGAAPAAARIRRQLRAGGARAVPRGPIAGTRANAAGLTRRQVQVLVLVDQGMSNLEIADRLCISPKTAEHHVSAVIARLGVATRRNAAVTARSLGLLGENKK